MDKRLVPVFLQAQAHLFDLGVYLGHVDTVGEEPKPILRHGSERAIEHELAKGLDARDGRSVRRRRELEGDARRNERRYFLLLQQALVVIHRCCRVDPIHAHLMRHARRGNRWFEPLVFGQAVKHHHSINKTKIIVRHTPCPYHLHPFSVFNYYVAPPLHYMHNYSPNACGLLHARARYWLSCFTSRQPQTIDVILVFPLCRERIWSPAYRGTSFHRLSVRGLFRPARCHPSGFRDGRRRPTG